MALFVIIVFIIILRRIISLVSIIIIFNIIIPGLFIMAFTGYYVGLTLGRGLSGGYMMRLAGRGIVDPVYSAISQGCFHTTKDNPADYLSRGCTSKQLKSSNWLHGPSWLLTGEYPEQTSIEVVVNELTVEVNPVHPIQPLIDLTRFSSFTRAIRVKSKVIEFCQSPANPFEKLVRQEQLLHCTSIHAYLNNPRVRVNVEVKTTVKQLSLYLENDTIRSKGRLDNSELPLDAITPLFLPNKSYLVDLLVNHIHSLHNHIGLSQTLSLYRQRCWTPKIRSRIKSLLIRCVRCQIFKGRTLSQPLPPPLPTERVQWVPPFSHVGVDHTGSYVIRDPQGRKSKVYICLFVCATTRAVHLEVVEDLTTSNFVMCLRRLTAAKGMPRLILSDNHRTF